MRRGQTMIEAMIAMSLLVIGFLGVIALLNRSVGVNRVVADNISATYLAAEGVEVVKNMLDGNYIQGRPFFTHFASCAPCVWEVQHDTDWDNPPRAYAARRLWYNGATGFYSQQAFGEETPFTRRVEVRLGGPNNNELVVRSVVDWRGRGGGQSSVDIEDRFYNWFPSPAPPGP